MHCQPSWVIPKERWCAAGVQSLQWEGGDPMADWNYQRLCWTRTFWTHERSHSSYCSLHVACLEKMALWISILLWMQNADGFAWGIWLIDRWMDSEWVERSHMAHWTQHIDGWIWSYQRTWSFGPSVSLLGCPIICIYIYFIINIYIYIY